MSNSKLVLNYCPNFYKIVNYDSSDCDALTSKIISIYREYIFKINPYNEDDIVRVRRIDDVISKYIDDYTFRNELRKEIVNVKISRDAGDILKEFVDSIIKIFNNYEEFTTRVVYISRWI
jgi:DNA invertase Pin-like site-specific DNA recombinase